MPLVHLVAIAHRPVVAQSPAYVAEVTQEVPARSAWAGLVSCAPKEEEDHNVLESGAT